MNCSTQGFPVPHYLLEIVQTNVHWINDAIQQFHPLLLPSPSASIFPSIRVFSNESALCIRWPKYYSFSFSICPSNEYSLSISFRIDWFNLLAAQGTSKSIFQHQSLKASVLWCSTFFMVQLSHLYMTTKKNIALTRQTFDLLKYLKGWSGIAEKSESWIWYYSVTSWNCYIPDS